MISRAAQWISAAEFPVLLLASPFFLFAPPSFAPILLLLPLLWLARRHSRGHFVPRTPVDWPVLGLLTMTLASAWITPDFLFSYRKIVGLLYGVAIFYAAVDWDRRQQSILPLTGVVVGMGCGAAILGLLGTEWVVKLPVLDRIIPHLPEMIRGLPGAESGFNPNQVTGALLLFLPLQVSLLSAAVPDAHLPRTKRLLAAVAVGLSLVLTAGVILLAQSRVAWVALALGFAAMIGIGIRRLRIPVLLLAGAGLVLLIIAGPVGVAEWLVQQGWMFSTGETSWATRLELWSRGLWTIAEFPLTGTGMNMFRQTVRSSYPLFHFPYGKDIGHAHHAYIQVALDLGLPGLVSYLALLGGSLAAGWQGYRRALQPLARLITLGSLVGLAVHAAWGFTDAVALGAKQSFLWWLMLAIVVSSAIRAADTRAESHPPALSLAEASLSLHHAANDHGAHP